MINLVLDTNILHQEGINSGRMQVLKTLIEAKIVKLYIPEIVKREFCTKRISTLQELLENSLNNFKGVHKKIEYEGDIKADVSLIEDKIRKVLDTIKSGVNKEFLDWEKAYDVEVLPFKPEDISTVLDDYFNGSGAFKSIKSRDDIPDSMIHTSLCRLADKVDQVHLLIKDGAFKKCMEAHPKVEVFDSLSDFFKVEPIAEHIAKGNLKEYFEGKNFSALLNQYLVTQEELIGDIYVPDGYVTNTDIIGINVYHAEINFPKSSDVKEVSISNFYAICKEKFTAEISFITTSSVHFVSDYGSYLELKRDGSRNIDLESMNGDGICDLYEVYQTRLSGSIEFSLTEALDFSQITSLTRNLCNDDSRLDISLDIENAELVGDFT